jgi:hypothetical protein
VTMFSRSMNGAPLHESSLVVSTREGKAPNRVKKSWNPGHK